MPKSEKSKARQRVKDSFTKEERAAARKIKGEPNHRMGATGFTTPAGKIYMDDPRGHRSEPTHGEDFIEWRMLKKFDKVWDEEKRSKKRSKGGTVRGAGLARQGVRKAKMR
jgi:hypothetical protein